MGVDFIEKWRRKDSEKEGIGSAFAEKMARYMCSF